MTTPIDRRKVLLAMGVTPLFAACASSADTDTKPDGDAKTDDGFARFLFVQSCRGAVLRDGELKLSVFAPTTLYFTDRPELSTGHVPTEVFVDLWGVGADDSFQKSPPSAIFSIVKGPRPRDIVVELTKARIDGTTLTYNVNVLSGDNVASASASSLFIDAVGRPLTPKSFGGQYRRVQLRELQRHRRNHSW